jgi:hypothetical protein
MTMTDERRRELYDRDQRRRELERMLKTHECAICHGPLVLLHTPYPTDWYLACGQDRSHVGYAKTPSLTQRALRGEPLPIYIIDRIKAKRRQTMNEDLTPEQQTALAPYHGVRTLTKQQATIVLRTIWPKAPDTEIVKAALLCRDYALHPLMKHVFLLPFKNKRTGVITWTTVLGIAATRLIASRRGSYSYVDGPRLMTDAEQEATFGEIDQGNLWAITVLQDDAGNRAPGYGNWPKGEEPKGTDKGNTKANMAFIRSERNALQRLRPGEIPTGVDVIDPSYIDQDLPDALPPEHPHSQVDEDTGEVTEPDEQGDAPQLPPDDLPIKTLGDLFNACLDWFGLKKPDVYRILNVRDATEIADLRDAWATVKLHKLPPEGDE